MSLLIELLIYAVMLVLQMAIDLITLAVAEGLMAVLHRMAAGRWPEEKDRPLLLLCLFGGGLCGALSVLVFPRLLMEGTLARLLALFVTPMVAAVLLGQLWSTDRDPDPRAARIYAWAFAQTMLLARLIGGV